MTAQTTQDPPDTSTVRVVNIQPHQLLEQMNAQEPWPKPGLFD